MGETLNTSNIIKDPGTVGLGDFLEFNSSLVGLVSKDSRHSIKQAPQEQAVSARLFESIEIPADFIGLDMDEARYKLDEARAKLVDNGNGQMMDSRMAYYDHIDESEPHEVLSYAQITDELITARNSKSTKDSVKNRDNKAKTDYLITELAEKFAKSITRGASEELVLKKLIKIDENVQLSVEEFKKFSDVFYQTLEESEVAEELLSAEDKPELTKSSIDEADAFVEEPVEDVQKTELPPVAPSIDVAVHKAQNAITNYQKDESGKFVKKPVAEFFRTGDALEDLTDEGRKFFATLSEAISHPDNIKHLIEGSVISYIYEKKDDDYIRKELFEGKSDTQINALVADMVNAKTEAEKQQIIDNAVIGAIKEVFEFQKLNNADDHDLEMMLKQASLLKQSEAAEKMNGEVEKQTKKIREHIQTAFKEHLVSPAADRVKLLSDQRAIEQAAYNRKYKDNSHATAFKDSSLGKAFEVVIAEAKVQNIELEQTKFEEIKLVATEKVAANAPEQYLTPLKAIDEQYASDRKKFLTANPKMKFTESVDFGAYKLAVKDALVEANGWTSPLTNQQKRDLAIGVKNYMTELERVNTPIRLTPLGIAKRLKRNRK